MTIPARPDRESHEFCGSCPMPKMHYYRHMRTDGYTPDDQFDNSDILKENLRHVRRRLADKERDLQAADAMVAEMRGEVERQGELLERWIEVFDMQMNARDRWLRRNADQAAHLEIFARNFLGAFARVCMDQDGVPSGTSAGVAAGWGSPIPIEAASVVRQ